MTSPNARSLPVQRAERIQVVDVLRGFAILGILLFNMKSFSGQSFFAGTYPEALDRWIVILIDFFVQAKFYSLFSFLFGWGMAVQMRRAAAKGTAFLPVYLRRLLILFVFGTLHSIFLWTGDILAMYAVIGTLMALIFRNSPPKVLLWASALLLLSGIVLTLPGEGIQAAGEWCRNLTQCFAPDAPLSDAYYYSGTYWQVTRLRFQGYLQDFWWFPCHLGNVFGMMLLGLYVGKRELFAELDQHRVLFRRVMWIGLAVGLPLNAVFAYVSAHPFTSEYFSLLRVGTRTVGAPALTLFYITGITLLFQRQAWRERLAPLALAGRMALSNYITHSLVLTFVFYGYGVGLYGLTDPSFGLVLTLLVYASQIAFSRWWFERYRFGPLEWIWRELTYNLRLTISLQAEPAVPREPLLRIQPRLAWLLAGLLVAAIPISLLIIKLGGKGQTPAAAVQPSPGQETQESGSDLETAPDEELPDLFSAYLSDLARESSGTQQALREPGELAETYDLDSAREYQAVLESDAYLGSASGRTGGWAAGDYLAGKFEQFGLLPLGSDGSYFQSFPLQSLQLDAPPDLRVTAPDGKVRSGYSLDADYFPVLGGYAGPGLGEGRVVWVVNCSQADFHELDVVGKIVFCRAGVPHDQARLAALNGASGLLLLSNPLTPPTDPAGALFQAWIPEPIPVFQVSPDTAGDLISGSGYAVSDLSILFDPLELGTGVRMEVRASSPCPQGSCTGRNLLGIIPGWDPEYAGRVIILSADYDSLGYIPYGQFGSAPERNISGLASLLEIARSWREQDFQPRMSVLFAIWDAREQDSLGVRYFLQNPDFPLEVADALIHLDGTGQADGGLQIAGSGFQEEVLAAAGSFDLDTVLAGPPGPAAQLLLEAGIPFLELSWAGAREPADELGLTADPGQAETEPLERAGQVAELLALQLSEFPPRFQSLLDLRCQALIADDLAGFQATSLAGRAASDSLWFKDVRSLEPADCGASFRNLRVTGSSARADVELVLEYPAEADAEPQSLTIRLPVRFQYWKDSWFWAGPDLGTGQTISSGRTRITIYHPGGDQQEVEDLGQLAAAEYRRITARLSLPADLDGQIYIYPNLETLKADTVPSSPARDQVWVGRGVLKFSYNPLSNPQNLPAAMAQLLLENSGIPVSGFPWLADGLPLVLDQNRGQTVLASDRLNQIAEYSAEGGIVYNRDRSWAAVEYLRLKQGWAGLGLFLRTLGQACLEQDCTTENGSDQALAAALQMDQQTFNAAWMKHWGDEIDRIQTDLNAVLIQRTEAVLSGDLASFLETVDEEVPNLVQEERDWLAAAARYPLEDFRLTGEPILLLDDGRFLASIILEYTLADVSESWGRGSLRLEILFTPSDGGYRWAGPLLDAVEGSSVQVRFPRGREAQAQALLEEAEGLYARLAEELNIPDPDPLTINLYNDQRIYRTSISLSYPDPDWAPGWSAAGHSIKFLLVRAEGTGVVGTDLVNHLTRHLLTQLGVQQEWLLSGGSSYLSRNVSAGMLQQQAAGSLGALNHLIQNEREFDLAEFPDLYRLPENDYRAAVAQAWDTVRFIAEDYGQDALMDLMTNRNPDLDSALQAVLDLSLSEFASVWKASFMQGHIPPSALETAQAFDVDETQSWIDFLSNPDFSGRLAGSEGSRLAADYLAEQFAEYGLMVDRQFFPVRVQDLLEIPILDLVLGGSVEELIFREDFLILQYVNTPDPLSGELVLVTDNAYTNMDLSGKVVLRTPTGSIQDEIDQAQDHGASALILIGQKSGSKDLQARYPIPGSTPADAIPVLELTRSGFDHLLDVLGLNKADLRFAPPALLLGTEAELRITLSEPAIQETANVFGFLPGTNPSLKDEVIIIGAHYDHVGDELGIPYSGANDNASGVAVLLEIARLWQSVGYQPQRSILFAAWGAQEPGALGSQAYLADPLYPLEDTVLALLLDGVGGGEGYYLEAAGTWAKDGWPLFSIQKAGFLAQTRLSTTRLDESVLADPEWLYSPAHLFSGASRADTGDDLPFRQAGIPTLLLRWTDASEANLPDSLADQVLADRLRTSGVTITAMLMSLAR